MDTIRYITGPLHLKNGAKITKRSTHIKLRISLSNESSFLHLAYTTDTISYVLGPGDAKTNAKTTSQSAHAKSRKNKSQIWSRSDLKRLNSGNECIFLHLATTTDSISCVPGPRDAKIYTLPDNKIAGIRY